MYPTEHPNTDRQHRHDAYLTVAEVAQMLAVSDDTVIKQFGEREGVIDIGTPEMMHKRRKRVLRISPGTLQRFIAERQVKVRR